MSKTGSKKVDTRCNVPDLKTAESETRRYYNLVAERYHDLFHDELDYKEYDKKLLTDFAASLPSGALVCDAGCGPSGHITRFLSNLGMNVVGVDCSEECIDIARRENPSGNFRVMDMSRLDFQDASFDGAVSYYSIIYAPKRYATVFIGELYRILNKGGRLLIVVKEGMQEGYIDDPLGSGSKVYFSHFMEEEIVSLIKKAGFRVTFLETRVPNEREISVRRVYVVGEK